MKLPVQVSYRHMRRSEPVEAFVRARAARLDKLSPQLLRCTVVVDAPHRRHRRGNVYRVSVLLTLPHGELMVGRDPALDHAHEDVLVAVRDAFRAARRELTTLTGGRRDRVKARRPAA